MILAIFGGRGIGLFLLCLQQEQLMGALGKSLLRLIPFRYHNRKG